MTVVAIRRDEPGLDAVVVYAFCGIAALVCLMATAFTQDPLFRLQGWIFTGAFVLASAAMTIGMGQQRFRAKPTLYEDGVIRAGVIATMFWGVVGMLVGVVIASQLSWPNIFYFPQEGWLNFGRLRPLHTSGVVFAFGGNAPIATSFWVVQRTCKARLACGIWPWFVFW